jgi:hypothetical protein
LRAFGNPTVLKAEWRAYPGLMPAARFSAIVLVEMKLHFVV